MVLRDEPQLVLRTPLASSDTSSHGLAATINPGSYLGTYTGTCNLHGDLGTATIANKSFIMPAKFGWFNRWHLSSGDCFNA